MPCWLKKACWLKRSYRSSPFHFLLYALQCSFPSAYPFYHHLSFSSSSFFLIVFFLFHRLLSFSSSSFFLIVFFLSHRLLSPLSHDMSETISNPISSTRFSQSGRSVVTRTDRSTGRPRV
ncbi:hypothetical protein GGI42DRAFT_329311 [Trichoderma sp. SZMC 28013]